jgi:hypothetical protein
MRVYISIFALLALAGIFSQAADKNQNLKMKTVEIRTYNLKPGTRAKFHKVASEQALPMVRGAGIDVVANGPSLHDENSYVLIRSFPSVEEREKQEDAFYNSAAWKNGPREAIMGCIESYTTVVMQIDDAGLASLHKAILGAKP